VTLNDQGESKTIILLTKGFFGVSQSDFVYKKRYLKLN